MQENKISPELIMALTLPENEREKSLNLNTGYEPLSDEWELIIRYTGDISYLREDLHLSVEELLGGYAVIRIPQAWIDRLSEYPEINYIEKPKALLFEEMEGIAASCLSAVRAAPCYLTGKGVLIACPDSGIDIYHPDFRNADGSTRIAALWDQTVEGVPPAGFHTGTLYSRSDINRALVAGQFTGGQDVVKSFDATGHGTAVAGIAAGNGFASPERIIGVAPEADIIAVKLGNPNERGFPRTTQLMLAVDFSLRFAMAQNMPLAVNISFGNNYGSHNGDSIPEQYLSAVSGLYRTVIATGAGNDGISARHASGTLSGSRPDTVEIYVADYLTSFNLQIWKYYSDAFDVVLESPTGAQIGPFSPYAGSLSYTLPNDIVSVAYGTPTPYNPQQEIYISWIPVGDYVTPGIWRIRLYPKAVTVGVYRMWLPVAGSTSAEVSFLRPDTYNTLAIPATAQQVISVAAYNSASDTYANFSGRGPLTADLLRADRVKPDLAAPGVGIRTCAVGGGYRTVSGTSFSAPFVTGAGALLMQYGIVDGRDPYLYGEKVRAALIRGAVPLPFQQKIPSPLVGWGRLCVADSLPL